MNRKSLLIVAAILLLGSAAVLFVSMQGKTDQFPAYTEADLAKARSKMGYTAPIVPTQQAIDPTRRVRLAIGSMGLGEERDRNVSDLMLAQLGTAPGLEMVERQELETVLKELQLSLSGLVRAGDAVRVGRLLRADWFLLGTPAVVNGTNVAVIRAVDARTGIMRNAAMFPQTKNEEQLALDLASFIRETRQEAAAPKQRTYLAIGTFQDLSVNNRHATLPANLRSQLIASYQGSEVTMLEREFVSALLKELYLDLAGLTEEGGTNAPAMQSAYWLVDGAYQSYETSQFEVEMVLNVRRMFGRNQRFELREKPGEPLFRRIKADIDAAFGNKKEIAIFTKASELKAQLNAAQELLDHIKRQRSAQWIDYTGDLSEGTVARQRRNTQEAILAAETALLLDPTNRHARFLLADCLSTSFSGQYDKACELYRELMDTPKEDELAREAMREVEWSFGFVSPARRQRWYDEAATRTTEISARKFFQEQAKLAAQEVVMRKVGTPESERVAEERLVSDILEWDKSIKTHAYSIDFSDAGLERFVSAYGTNKALAASKLVALLPKLQKVSTNLAPHIFAGVVAFQVDTNAPILKEFERSLESFEERDHPYPEENYYIDLLSSPVYRWAEKRKLYRLAAKLKEVYFDYQYRQNLIDIDDEDQITLGYDLLRIEEWEKALAAFQSCSNRPVMMGSSGPWGRAFTVVLPEKQATLCRQKLGLPTIRDPREFELGTPWFCPGGESGYHKRLALAAASDGLWTGMDGHVMNIGFDLRTNSVVKVIEDPERPITALCPGSANLWVGTDGRGLFSVDKATKKVKEYTEADGLLMDQILSLYMNGSTLWIGYGSSTRGALGCLETASGKFTSFVASLSAKGKMSQPPSAGVADIHALASGEIWCRVGTTLLRCKPAENVWDSIQADAWTTCYDVNSDDLIFGLELPQVAMTIERVPGPKHATNRPVRYQRFMTYKEAALYQNDLKTNGSGYRVSGSGGGAICGVGEVGIRRLSEGTNRRLLGGGRLPGPPTAISRNGRDLWVGGMGFLALIDLDQDKIVKLAYIQARQVDSIQFGGGWVWVQFNKHLYRIPENLRTR